MQRRAERRGKGEEEGGKRKGGVVGIFRLDPFCLSFFFFFFFFFFMREPSDPNKKTILTRVFDVYGGTNERGAGQTDRGRVGGQVGISKDAHRT